MGNELGKLISNGLNHLTLKALGRSSERDADTALAKAASRDLGRDTLVRSERYMERAASALSRGPAADVAEKAGRDAASKDIAGKALAGGARKEASAAAQKNVEGTLVKELPKATAKKPITFLTYSASDNELAQYVDQHVADLGQVGTTPNVNVLAFTDKDGIGDSRMYLVQKETNPKKLVSPFVQVGKDGEVNMSDPASLSQAVKSGFGNYPSEMTWLDGNNHGAGYFGLFQDRESLTPMRLPGIAQAVLDGNGGKPVDLFSVDACEMDCIEFGFQMRKAAKAIVASEDETFPMGMHYGQTLAELSAHPTTDPIEVAKLVAKNVQMTGKDIITAGDGAGVKRVYQVAVLDTSKADTAAQAVDELSNALITALDTKRPQVLDALKGVKTLYVANHGGYDWNMRDLPSIATALKQNVDDPAVKAAADKVLAATTGPGGMVVQSASAAEEAGATLGLSIYTPLDGKVDPVWQDTDFAKSTHWGQFLQKLGTAPAGKP